MEEFTSGHYNIILMIKDIFFCHSHYLILNIISIIVVLCTKNLQIIFRETFYSKFAFATVQCSSFHFAEVCTMINNYVLYDTKTSDTNIKYQYLINNTCFMFYKMFVEIFV